MNQGYAGTAMESIGNSIGIGGAAMGNRMSPPPTPDCIGTHMGELDAAISNLNEEIAMLGQRIETVLRPNVVADAKQASSPTPIRSNVANYIVNQIEAVRQITRRVRDLRDCVDL